MAAMVGLAVAGISPPAAGDVRVEEGETATIVIPISKTVHIGESYSYKYETVGVTALKNIDYKHVSGTLTFWPGQWTKSIDIKTYDDDCGESDETFRLKVEYVSCSATYGSCFVLPNDATTKRYTVTIENVGGEGTTYAQTKYGCSGSSGGTFGE